MIALRNLKWGRQLVCLVALAATLSALAQPATNSLVETKTPPAEASAAKTGEGQAELIQKLLNRIERLEQRDAERSGAAAALDQTHAEREQKLLGRIAELETKVGSLESAKVLPEIAVSSDDAPSNRELDQKLRVIQRNNELAAEAAEERSKDASKISIGANGFTFTSADTNFAVRLRGLAQLDSRSFFNDNGLSKGNDGFVLRRVRPIIEGTVFRDFDFQFVPDFGGSTVQIFDAYLNYRYAPELQLRGGKFKGPVGLEQLESDAMLPFNERSAASALVPIRSVGLQLWGEIVEGALGYAVGIFNEAGDTRNAGTSDFTDDKEFAGRISAQPFKHTGWHGLEGLGFGIGLSYSQVRSNAQALPNTTGGTLPGYVSDGQQQFFAYNPVTGTVVADGSHWRIAPYLTYLNGPFGLLGEYTISRQTVLNNATLRQANLEHTAWQVSAQYVLTGESASFNGIVPRHPFSWTGGGWGAWQFVARYAQLNIDDATFPNFANPDFSARGATSWSVGINWWLNRNVRLLTSFSHTTFDGGGTFNALDPRSFVPPATVSHQDESLLFTRLQLAF